MIDYDDSVDDDNMNGETADLQVDHAIDYTNRYTKVRYRKTNQ